MDAAPARPRLRRHLRRAAAGTCAGAVALPLALLRPLDRAPWHEDPAARPALAAAAEMHRQAAAARPAPLEAGWATVPLDLREVDPLAGYGARKGAPSAGGGEVLEARALFLRAADAELVLVTADVLLIHAAVAAETAARCAEEGLPPEALYFLATHTHGGPGGWGANWLEQAVCGRHDPGAAARLAERLARAAREARAAARPAEWRWIRVEAPAHVTNRTAPGGAVDPWLDALVARRLDDGATGLLAIYGAHATCLGPDRMTWAADYPGALVRHLEDGGLQFAAFGAGAVGSQSPRGKGRGKERAEDIGQSLAGHLLEALAAGGEGAWCREMALGAARRDLPVPRLQLRLGGSLRASDWAGRTLHGPVAPFHVARIDEHWLAGVPVEFSAMLSAPLREEARAAGTWLCATAFNGDYLGYVLPPELYDSGAYEAEMNFLGPGGGQFTVEVIRALCGLPRTILLD